MVLNRGMTKTQGTEAAITEAHNHYGFPTVWVEPYRTTDSDGNQVEVHCFYQNGGMVTAEGCRIKKDGEPYQRPQVVLVPGPQNVLAALAGIQ